MGGHTARIEEVRHVYKILVRKPGGKRLLARYNIKTNHTAPDREQRQILFNTAVDLRIP
jgi:hypothetical protein